ncbi:MAG: chemotaxis protein CheD [Candidatus Bathyarchaeia archaeon]
MHTSAYAPKICSITATSWDTTSDADKKSSNACRQLNATAYTTTYKTTNESSQMSPTVEEVRVDMADMKAEIKPVELVTSVGSCVAICLYDSKHKCGGLAHIMLPNSAIAPNELLPSKFADTAVPALAKLIHKVSGRQVTLSAKIAGGANMFPTLKNNALNIGAKNIDAVKVALNQHNIRLISEDVGGQHGRRITFNLGTGIAKVRRFNGETREI